ncbi:MAG: serine--tRNA ligase, partial [Raoultibacter sp.]
MLDIRFVRENQDAVAKAMEARNAHWDKARFAQLEQARRGAIAEEEALQAQRNATSKSIGAMMGAGKTEEAEAAKASVRQINEQLALATA